MKDLWSAHHERRQSNSKGPEIKPEAYVAKYNDGKFWARNNGKGGVSMYEEGQRKPTKQDLITNWLPGFAETRADRRTIILKCLSDFVKGNPLNTDTSTTSHQKGSDTPSIYTTAQSDLDIF